MYLYWLFWTCALSGILPPQCSFRKSLRHVTGAPVTWRTDFLNEHWGGQIPDNAQVQNGQYKYTEYYAEPPPIETELYDLSTDPYELTNRTNDSSLASVKSNLKARLDALRAE